MIVYPAIDLLGGNVVRLEKGQRESAIVYSYEPAKVAKQLFGSGAKFVHLIDLDAAFGIGSNLEAIKSIAELGKTQLGGGIRNASAAKIARAIGVERVIVGSALSDGKKMKQIKAAFGKEIFAALDFSKSGDIMAKGWTKKIDFSGAIDSADGIISTSIDSDGSMRGADRGLFNKLSRFDCPKGYAGGIGREKDLEILEKQGWDYAIVGKALYEGAIPLERLKEWF